MTNPSYHPHDIDPETLKTVNRLWTYITGQAPMPIAIMMAATAAQTSSDTPVPQAKVPAPDTQIPDPWYIPDPWDDAQTTVAESFDQWLDSFQKTGARVIDAEALAAFQELF
ncbi:MAG: hypothetical protein ACFCVB_02380 [Nodosilinea sp.]